MLKRFDHVNPFGVHLKKVHQVRVCVSLSLCVCVCVHPYPMLAARGRRHVCASAQAHGVDLKLRL